MPLESKSERSPWIQDLGYIMISKLAQVTREIKNSLGCKDPVTETKQNKITAHNAFLPCPVTTCITCVRTNVSAESKDGRSDRGHPPHTYTKDGRSDGGHPHIPTRVLSTQLAGFNQMILLSS